MGVNFMEPETNTQNWNDDYQTQNQTNPSRQPQISSSSRSQWVQQAWLKVKVTTWLKYLIIVVALTIAAVLVVPKFTSADNQQQDSASSSVDYSDVEYDWYNYDYQD